MIIYNIQGQPIADVLITKSAVHEEELMKKNLVRLSWRDVEKRHYPVGTYIKPFADKGDETPYFLFQPYEPEQVNEVDYKYAPEFHHPTMYLGYVPYVNSTKNYDGQDITKLDWSYVGGTAELLADVCKAINAALKDANLLSDGEEFRVEVISTNNVAIKDATNVTFASVDIFVSRHLTCHVLCASLRIKHIPEAFFVVTDACDTDILIDLQYYLVNIIAYGNITEVQCLVLPC